MNPPSLAPLLPDDWPDEISDLHAGFAGTLNVYRTMAHHPQLLRGWSGLREHIVNNTALGRTRAEVVILRCAHRFQAGYEWSHHILRGRAQGLDDRRIRAISGPTREMAGGDALLAQAVDELVDVATLTPETRDALVRTVGAEGALDLMATVGFYATLAYVVKSFGTPLDENVEQGLAENPLSG